MKTIEICHFCLKDFTDDPFTYLLEGPTKEVNICEYCVDRANTIINNRQEVATSYQRCDMCGTSRDTWHYGCSPYICRDCLLTVTQLTHLARGNYCVEN